MRILLVRLDGVGDAVVCTPLLAALRAAGHEVGVALTTRNAGVFAAHALLAEHILERIPWPAHGSTTESTARARAAIVAQRYEAALIASEEPEAYALAAGIPQRVGFTTGWARPFKTLWVRSRVTRAIVRSQRVGGETAHEVEILYRLGRGFVADAAPTTDRAALRAMLLDDDRGRGGARGIVVQAGPKWKAIGVADDALRALIEQLGTDDVRVVAAAADVPSIRSGIGITAQTFASLREWIVALDGARTVISTDSGAAHVAGMLGAAVLDVFPDAHFAAQVRRWRPWSAPYRAVRASAVRGSSLAGLAETVRNGF